MIPQWGAPSGTDPFMRFCQNQLPLSLPPTVLGVKSLGIGVHAPLGETG